MSSNIYLDPFDRSNGNGSRTSEEDWLDEHTTSAENEWSSAKTTFYYWDAPAHKQRQYQELYEKQHGKGDSNRSAELPRMRALADTDSFCSMLELPNPVRERATHIVQNIDISSNETGGKSYEKIILAVISLVYDEHLSSLPPDSVQYDQRLIFDDTFRDLMDNNAIGSKELRGIREQVRTSSDYF